MEKLHTYILRGECGCVCKWKSYIYIQYRVSTDLELRDILRPKNVHIPRDIVNEHTSVMIAATPNPILLFTRSILPI